jgi:DNA-directed RNA polymerase sigma subunit (sigma70/sigma32)
MYWIRSSVKASQMFQSRVITVPHRVQANQKRVLRTEKELRQILGRKPTAKELSEAIGMSELQIERCLRAMDQRIYSLDQTITNKYKPNSEENEKGTMYELISSITDDGEYEKLQRDYLREDLIDTLNRHLTPSEVELLLLRYGLMDETKLPPGYEGPLTIAQVSELVGLKPDKVRRLIIKSLKQLKFVIGEEWYDFERLLA